MRYHNVAWFWRWKIMAGMLILLLLTAAAVLVSLRKVVKQRTSELQQSRADADQANAAKSRFLAAASHDMRQPMQAMRLYIDVLAERLDKADNQTVISKLQTTHRDLSELLDRCLDISHLDSGTIKPQLEIFDLTQLLHRLHEQYLPMANAAGLSFQMHLPAARILANSDPAFVKGILANLISNAIRYTQRGGLLLSTRQHGSGMCLEVCDNGLGIEEDNHEIIFQEFVQLDNSGRDPNQGVGLGLAIASRMCRLLGTRIHLKSKPGRGSLFFFEVPLALCPDQAYSDQTAMDHESTQKFISLAGLLVFVIDDDAQLRDSLSLSLAEKHSASCLLIATRGKQQSNHLSKWFCFDLTLFS